VAAGARSVAGNRLERDFSTIFTVLPALADVQGGNGTGEASPAAPEKPAVQDPAAGTGVTGAALFLEGCGIFTCDRQGYYRAPRFDRVRLHFSGQVPGDIAIRAVLLEVSPDGEVRRMPTRLSGSQTWVDLVLEEETRPGWTYECRLLPPPSGPPGAAAQTLYSWLTHGSPRIYVWSLDLTTGRTNPVGRLDLGMEIDQLVGAPGGILAAVGSPGGTSWNGLQIIQTLTPALSPASPPVAIFTDANYAPRQINLRGDAIAAVGPLGPIPALVGDQAWQGFVPGGNTGNTAVLHNRGEEHALFKVTADFAYVLGYGSDLDGDFVSGPALSADGGRAAFLTHDFTDNALVRLWSLDLSGVEETEPGVLADPRPPRELARVAYPNEVMADFGYGGGATWTNDDSALLWDVWLPDGVAEIWAVDPAGVGARELIATGSGLPLPSPCGRWLFCRGPKEISILASDGRRVRRTSGAVSAAAWLPDGSGLLVSDDHGVLYLPVSGNTRRLASFSAGPGCFVGAHEYWFVSDRRF
jgi:hypothetical protein